MTVKGPIIKHTRRSWLKLGLLTVCLVVFYTISYCVNSFFGGYWSQPEMDGRDRYSFGLAMPTAIMWQPRFGHEAIGNLNHLGAFYTPLIRVDRRFFHPTIYLSDDEGFKKASDLPTSKVHPFWRDEHRTSIAAEVHPVEPRHALECKLRLAGSDLPRTLTEIWISRELAKALGTTAPSNFTETSFEDHHTYFNRTYVRWVGQLPLVRDRDVTVFLPFQGFDSNAVGVILFQSELNTKSGVHPPRVTTVKFQYTPP